MLMGACLQMAGLPQVRAMKQGTGQGAAGLCTTVGLPGSGQEGAHEGKRRTDGQLFVATPVPRVVWTAKALAPATHRFGSLPTSAPDGGFRQAEAEGDTLAPV